MSAPQKEKEKAYRNPEPETRNLEPGTRNPEPGTWNSEPGTHSPKAKIRKRDANLLHNPEAGPALASRPETRILDEKTFNLGKIWQ